MPYLVQPWFAAAGLLAATAVFIAHMITAHRRAPRPLPTTRFVPRTQQRAAAVERRPRDLVLLVLRAGAVLAAAFALAGPSLQGSKQPVTPLTIVDLTGVANQSEVWDSARAVAGTEDLVLISGDSVHAARRRAVTAAIEDPERVSSGQSMTPALIAAIRRGAEAASAGRPTRLSIISAFTQQSLDSATLAVRALWPGRIRLIPVRAATDSVRAASVEFRGAADDPLRATTTIGRAAARSDVLLVRDSLTTADSAAARSGRTVVHWPLTGVPASFSSDGTVDTVHGLWLGNYSWVAPLSRRGGVAERTGRVPARWMDGQPAVVERTLERGCIREVAVDVPDIGDLVISRGAIELFRVLSAPCGAARSASPLTPSQRQQLAGSGNDTVTLRRASILPDARIVRVLLALSLLALLGESVLRRRRA